MVALVAVGLFALALFLVAYGRARGAAPIFKSLVDHMERSTKGVGALSLVPGLGVTGWLISRGLDERPAGIVGALVAFGLFCIALGALRMEGLLTEAESSFRLRVERGAPPPSSPKGRVIAILVGAACVAVAGYAVALLL